MNVNLATPAVAMAIVAHPDDAEFHCCIPLGYPRGSFGPTRRFPTVTTTGWNSWGTPPPW